MNSDRLNTALASLSMGSRSGASGAEVTDQLVPFVYEELRKMARRQLAGERHQQTLNTTGLVHEAYLKLVDHTQVSERGRSYFFAAAACAMRQVLVDAARRRNRLKRGAGLRPEPLEEARLELEGFTARVLHLEEALEALAAEFPRQAQVVECRFFGGLTVVETSQALDISPRTVKGDWALARAWLFRALQSPS